MRSQLILGLLLSSSLVAQSVDAPGAGGSAGGGVAVSAAPKAKKTTSQVSNLLKIASDLRASGRHDIAAAIEAQAKKLWTTSKGRRRPGPAGPAVGGMGAGPSGPVTGIGGSVGRVRPAPSRVRAPAKPKSPRYMRATDAPRPARAAQAPRPTAVPPGAAAQLPRAVAAPRAVRGVARPGARPTAVDAPPKAGVGRSPRSTHGKEYYRRIPQIDRRTSLGVLDEGRSRYKVMPTPTKRDAKGRVEWGGLPSEKPRSVVARRSEADLQQRVARLQQDVKEMSRLLNKLHKELEKQDRKRRMR